MPVGRAQHAAEAFPRELAGQQVDGGDAGHQGQQGAQPDALQLHGRDLGARHGREQQRAEGGQHVPAAAQRLPRRAGQRDRLQQRHHRQHLVRASLLQGQAGGPVRADVEGEFGDELGQVQADLQVAGGYVAVARVEQHGLAVVGEQDAVRGQPAMGDMTGVQPVHRVPDLLELVVAAAGIPLGQRRPVVVLVGEHGGLGTHSDQGAQPRRGRARVFRRVGEQRPVLDRAVH